jgi:hypothetical protein|tara:strand:- start:587 stop:2392 length:1806 start_codon:yes stop_codon:yes gene_type:complete
MNNLHLIELSQYEKPVVTEEKNRDWVGIGEDNNYYQELIDCFMNSTTNKSVITGIAQQIYGKGLDATDSSKKPEQYAAMKGLFKPDCLRKICLDLKMLGEASLQVSYSGKKVASVTHFPRETLRAEKMDKSGKVKNYYYAPDWTEVTKATELTKIPVFGSKGTGNEIFIIKRYIPSFYYYSPADYATSYAVLESEISDYLINESQHSFSPRGIINFNSGIPSEEKMIQIKNQIKNQMTGSEGEKLIVSFNHNAEQKATVDAVPVQQAPELYQYLSEECSKKIMLTHRVTSPLLIGLRDMSGGGLGSNEDEIIAAQRLFTNTTIKPYQELICDSLSQILEVNGVSLNLYFKTSDPLEFIEVKDIDNDEVKEEETGVKKEVDEIAELEMMASKATTTDLPNEVYDIVLEGLKGEVIDSEKWEVADVRDVDEKNISVDDWAENTIELNLSETIDDKEDGFSTLDKSYYKVRYKYVVGSKKKYKKGNKSRPFCEAMMARTRQGIVYRLEDIDKASREMNFKAAELPMHNGQKYDLFRFKGGIYCRHSFREVLFKLKQPLINKGKKSNKISDHKKVSSIPNTYKPKPRGRQQAKKAPVNMPKQGAY